MRLLLPDSQIVHSPCEDFDFQNPQVDPLELSKEMVKFMRDNNALGLSANQVESEMLSGTYRPKMFCMRADPNLVCINPRIVYYSNEEVLLEEGCLTYPGLIVKVRRPKNIRVRFHYPNGELVTRQYDGMAARVFQHEFDHLDGVVFLDRVSKLQRDMAERKLQKRARAEKRFKERYERRLGS